MSTSPPAPFLRRLFASIWTVPLSVLTILGGVLVWVTLDEREATLESEYRFLEAHARIADAQIESRLHSADLLLRQLAEDATDHPGLPVERMEGLQQQRMQQEPQARLTLITDAAGRIRSVYSTEGETVARTARGFDASAREYFVAQRDAAPEKRDRLFISRPFTNTSARVNIVVSRAIRDNRGRFVGVAAATMRPEFFADVLRQIRPAEPGSAATVFNAHGDVIHRQPDPERHIGASIAQGEPYRVLSASPQRTVRYLGHSALDGIQRVFVFRRIGDSGLVIGISRRVDDVLVTFWRNLSLRLAMFALAAAAVLGLTRLAQQRQRARDQAEEELRLAAMVYQNSSEAMLVADENVQTVLAINPAFTTVTGYAPNEIVGNSVRLLDPQRHAESFYQEIVEALRRRGHWRGEAWSRRRDGESFAIALSLSLIRGADGRRHRCVALFSDITAKKQSEERIWQHANFDALTGLPNRRQFHDRLGQEIRRVRREGRRIALILIDMDHFKEVNDTLGHAKGDLLLIEAARRIRAEVRETDVVARLGGDEFAVILTELGDPAQVANIADSLITTLVAPFALAPEQAYVSASAGIAFYPGDAEREEDLLMHADQAMYQAKAAGRNRFCHFTAALQLAAEARMRTTADLRHAVAGNQLLAHYQPIVELASGRIAKAEALVRWRHPERGLVPPADFIPLAEETGLIGEIGDWVFRQAAAQVGRLRSRYDSAFQVTVNTSPVQFRHRAPISADWSALLEQRQLPGNSIVVEITESLLLDASDTVQSTLLALRDAGTQVAIDDFGTGYSSLSYLKKFDIDYLKIDQSFVRNLASDEDDVALCVAIIMMAHRLGLKVIAEGVETEEQRAILAAAGCDYGQGYLFSRPLAAADFEAFLDAWSG